MYLGMARKLIPTNDRSFNKPSTPGASEKLRTELSERTAELSRLRDQMADQQRELETLRNKLRTHEMVQGNLEDTAKELVH